MDSLDALQRLLRMAVVLMVPTNLAAGSQQALLQISDHPMFGQPARVEIREALLFDSLSVFIGKTGMIRNRGGTVAGVVVLSSQQLGCGRFQRAYPAMVVVGEKRAKEFEERIAVSRPQPAEPPISFSADGPGDFEIWAVAQFLFDPRDMEKYPAYRPTTYRFLEGLLAASEAGSATAGERVTRGAFAPSGGEAGGFSFVVEEAGSVELRPKEFNVLLFHGAAPAGGEDFRLKANLKNIERSPPLMAIYRSGDTLRGIIDVKNKQFAVQADLELRKCPALEHIHIEPQD